MDAGKNFDVRNIGELFKSASRLVDNESNEEDPKEPYKFKYEARELLLEAKSKLSQLQDNENPRYTYIEAMLNYHVGLISMETEELSTGDEHLQKALELLTGFELKQEVILTLLCALNQTGILWSRRGDADKSLDALQKSEKWFREYKTSVGLPPYEFNDLFATDQDLNLDSNFAKLESVHTLTFFYLAQIYQALGETVKAAKYCHTTLRRQMESGDYDPLSWALNAAVLSQFYVGRKHFDRARHHLQCATYVLDGLRDNDVMTKNENYEQNKAEVARCWVGYHLALLVESKQNTATSDASPLLQLIHNFESDMEFAEEASVDDKPFVFDSLEIGEPSVAAECCTNFDEARAVFQHCQSFVVEAKQFFTLDGYASDYAELVQKQVEMYDVLAFFEDSNHRKCKMHKRRIDLLEELVKELNPKFFLDKCRELWLAFGDALGTLMDLKLDMGVTGVKAQLKVNVLADRAIKVYDTYLESFSDIQGQRPASFPEESERNCMLCHFIKGRLYSKIQLVDTPSRVELIQKSMDEFTMMVEYCEAHPSAMAAMRPEVEVSKETIALLPSKIKAVLSGSM